MSTCHPSTARWVWCCFVKAVEHIALKYCSSICLVFHETLLVVPYTQRFFSLSANIFLSFNTIVWLHLTISLSSERLLLFKYIDHSLPLRPIPGGPCQVLQGNICPLSSAHNTLYHLCHRPPEQLKREQKFIFSVHTGRPFLSQVCHVEPASIAPYAGGAFWV